MDDLSPEIENQLNELADIDQRIIIESQNICHNQIIVAITMDKSIINVNSIEFLDAIRFVLLLKPTYPETPPRLYCITRFCEPELCDARDLLEDTLQMKWDPQKCFLKLIISQLPSLIRRYLIMTSNYNNENEMGAKRKMFGKYYLDSIYDLTIIKYIPYLYFDVISEVTSSDEKSMNLEDRKILITDNFLLLFCNKSLYELDQLQLIFVGPITSLTYIRQFIKDGIVLLKWFVKGKGAGNYSTFTMQLRTPDGNYIVDTLIDNLSKQKIKFKVTNKKDGNIVREGAVPRVEISLVEEEIKHLEDKINKKEDISKESISVLINLYEKAIQYYSAMNDKKFEEYIKKIQNIYSNNEYTSLLNMKTISSANNQYNVTQFKRKRKKRGNNDEEGTGKKKKEKKSKKKSDKKIETKNEINKENENNENKEENDNENEKEIQNEDKDKEEEKNENNINNINNETEKKVNDENKKEEDNNNIQNEKEGNNDNSNDNNINEIKDSNDINNENKDKKEENKDEKKEDKKEENKNEDKQQSKPKRNTRKREEGNQTFRKKRNDRLNMESPKSQRMLINKKEIEEMLKNEITSEINSNINNEIKEDIKDKDKNNNENGQSIKEESKEPNGQEQK